MARTHEDWIIYTILVELVEVVRKDYEDILQIEVDCWQRSVVDRDDELQ